jgi:hypothetical protein
MKRDASVLRDLLADARTSYEQRAGSISFIAHAIETKALAGKKIYVSRDLNCGFGDTFQFAPLCVLLQRMGAQVTLGIQKILVPLLSSSSCADEVIMASADEAPPANGKQYDAAVTMMSLPAVLGINVPEDLPSIPRIAPRPERNELWQKKLENEKRLKIGLCWEASKKNDADMRIPMAHRSMQLAPLLLALGSLQRTGKVALSCLQQVSAEDKENFEIFKDAFEPLETPNKDFDKNAFEDTAAVMKQMDIVISPDTATAHLAAAVGTPEVITALPFSSDWRWVVGSDKSPWYPTVTCYKQEQPFDWTPVITNLVTHIKKSLEKRS